MSITAGIDELLSKSATPYSVSASVNDGGVDAGTSTFQGNSSASLSDSASKELGKMDFLRLLTAQLQYQDPLNPMDNTEFVSQLAQFSALEGTNNVEAAINSLDTSFKDNLDVQSFSALSMTNASAVSLIGKRVRIGESTIQYSGITGDDPTVRVHLGNANTGTVKVLNDDGETVRTVQVGNKDAQNSATFTWDGKNDAGDYARVGKYYLYVDGQENDPSLYCFVEDMVEGVRYTTEGPLVKIGGKELAIGDILDVSMTETDTSIEQGVSETNALTLLGKNAKYQKAELTYRPASGQYVDINADLGGFASTKAQVKDATGAVVYTFDLNADATGNAHMQFDCVDFNNAGPYTISLVGNTNAFFYGEGKVDGIVTANGTTKVKVNGVPVSLSEIFEISTATA